MACGGEGCSNSFIQMGTFWWTQAEAKSLRNGFLQSIQKIFCYISVHWEWSSRWAEFSQQHFALCWCLRMWLLATEIFLHCTLAGMTSKRTNLNYDHPDLSFSSCTFLLSHGRFKSWTYSNYVQQIQEKMKSANPRPDWPSMWAARYQRERRNSYSYYSGVSAIEHAQCYNWAAHSTYLHYC